MSILLYSTLSRYALQELTKLLPDTFKEPISDKLRKRFEYEFHSASYDIITEVLSALRVIVANLSKALQECRGGDLDKINALEFIKTYYEDLHDQEEVLREIGIQGATTAHLKCLESLPLVATYSCFEFFYNYAKEGHYDFIAVPYRFKAQLSDQDQSTLEQIRTTWPSTTNELLKELQQLVDALKHSERNIISHTSEEANVSLSVHACKEMLSHSLIFTTEVHCGLSNGLWHVRRRGCYQAEHPLHH